MLQGLIVLHLRDPRIQGRLLMLPVLVLLQGQAILVRHILVVVLMLGILTGVTLLPRVHRDGVSLVESMGITHGSALPRTLPHPALMQPR